MSSRYSLRSQQPRRAVRRLSPTAVRNTGPLQRPEKLEIMESKPVTIDKAMEPGPGPSASANHTTMPTEIKVDAARPLAGVKDDPSMNESGEEPSLSSSMDDDSEHHYVSPVEPDPTELENSTATGRYACPATEMLDEHLVRDVNEARNKMTRDQQEQIDKRMEKVSFLSNPGNPENKGKGIDPRNWGDLEVEEEEMDPVIQQEILTDLSTIREKENPAPNREQDSNADFHGSEDNAGDPTDRIKEFRDCAAQHEPSREEVLDYLRNKRILAREMDRLQKGGRSSPHKRRKGRSASEPISDELAALIQKVAEGSKIKQKYRPKTSGGERSRRFDRDAATKPITQISSQSALGRAFD